MHDLLFAAGFLTVLLIPCAVSTFCVRREWTVAHTLPSMASRVWQQADPV